MLFKKINELQNKQIKSMFKMSVLGTTGHLIVVFLTISIFYNVIEKTELFIFLALFIIALGYRYLVTYYYNKSNAKSNKRKWILLYTSSVVITSLLWTIGTIFVSLQGLPVAYEYLLFSIIVGIGAIGVATFGIVFFSYRIYLLTLFTPYGIYLLYEGDKFHFISGVLLMMALPFLLKAAYDYSISFAALIINDKRLLKREKEFSDATLKIMIKVLEEKDPYTAGHAERVSKLCVDFGEKLNLSKHEICILEKSAYLHDIGKIAIPDYILKKTGLLTENEYEIMKSHPEKGYEILSIAENETIEECLPAIRHHHERYDGLGYPDRLTNDETPYFSKIISIVDTFDAMTSSRSYRSALPISVALDEIKRGSGKQFDPKLAEIFLNMMQQKSDDQYKISEIITELRREHDEILSLCSNLRKHCNNPKEIHTLLANIGDLLLKHAEKEDKYIYPTLKKEAEKDKNFKQSLESFLHNTNDLISTYNHVLEVFSSKNREKKYYKENLDKLAVQLNERIKKEEGILFPIFEERINNSTAKAIA